MFCISVVLKKRGGGSVALSIPIGELPIGEICHARTYTVFPLVWFRAILILLPLE
jgi:hypothetical protein